jgi:hypothetical protein
MKGLHKMQFLLIRQFPDLICGILSLLVIMIIPILIYFLGKNYIDKRNAYYRNLYQRAVDKAIKKKEQKDK